MSVADHDARAAIAARADVSREIMERLEGLVAHIDAWRGKMNLVGPREFDRIWTRHVDDSLQLLDHLESPEEILDLGSGGGFPGLVLAAACPPPVRVTLAESVGKKCVFLQSAIDTLGLPARVIHARIEAIDPFPADLVTARAFAPLPKLLDYAGRWLENGAVGLFHKGKSWQEELTAANRHWAFRHDVFASRTDPAAVILRLSEVRRNG